MSLDAFVGPPSDPGKPFRPQRSPLLWLIEREVLRYLRIWRYALLGPVLSTLLFVVVFGSVMGRELDRPDGVSYGAFIVPGLVSQLVVNVGFFNGTTSLFEARRDRYVNDVFASPLRMWEINLALTVSAMIRGFLVAVAVLAIALPLTRVGVAEPAYLLVASVAVLVVGAQLGVVAGAIATSLDHVYSIEALVLLPLGFLGGIFYSLAQLPGHWDIVSYANPMLWVVQVLRIGFLGQADVSPALGLLVVWVFAFALTGWSTRIFATSRTLKP